jgi:hypothetical protein
MVEAVDNVLSEGSSVSERVWNPLSPPPRNWNNFDCGRIKTAVSFLTVKGILCVAKV